MKKSGILATTRRVLVRWTPVLLGGFVLVAGGCRTTSPTGAKVTAAATISGRDLAAIRVATLDVFEKAGFAVMAVRGRDMVFEKKAGAMGALIQGGWSDPAVWMRVKLHIEELRPEVNVLECSVYRLSNKGDDILEEETYAYGARRGPYQALLDKIAARLESRP
jgi:hypothetical protein